MEQGQGDRLRVLIADDHVLVRDAVASALKLQGAFDCEAADSYASTMELLDRNDPFDITMVDLNMPGMEGVRSLEEIIKDKSAGAVILFSGFVTKDFVMRSIAAGARGFVPKTLKLSALGSALRFVASGEIFVPMSFLTSEKNEPSVGVPLEGRATNLNPKELEVLKLAAMGLPNKEIAWRADCTEVRVKMHMRSACKKLGAENRTGAAMRARELGIL